jgi:ribonuclease P protein component
MRKEHRLRRRQDFAAAYRKGRVHGNNLLVLRVLPNGRDVSRFGFVTGKAVGNAVTRNKVKRRLREIARQFDVQPGFDLVIGARKPAASAVYMTLQRSLASLMQRSGALAHPPATQEQPQP